MVHIRDTAEWVAFGRGVNCGRLQLYRFNEKLEVASCDEKGVWYRLEEEEVEPGLKEGLIIQAAQIQMGIG